MSTKIYFGARIPHGIAEAYRLILKAKPEVEAIAQRIQNEAIAWLVVKSEETENPITPCAAWFQIEGARMKCRAKGLRHLYDFDFELALFPRTRDCLAIPYTDSREMQSWFGELPFVQEYGYWNNTDKPDSVSQRDWGTRKRAWDKAFRNRANETCLVFDFVKASNLDFPKPGAEWDKLKAEAVVKVAEAKVMREEARSRLGL